MEEESLRFWIIPIVCIVLVGGLFGFMVVQKINVEIPNSIIEQSQMQAMSCNEIKAKDATGLYASLENSRIGRDKIAACNEADAALKKAEQDRLTKLLADPTSFESLSRDLKKFQEQYDSFKEKYETHASETAILKQNMTDFESKLSQTKEQLESMYPQKLAELDLE